MIPFNYHHLFYFYTIAEEGTITKACKTLRIAQPTLSAQLRQFENYLDRKLFLREGKKLILTEDGHHILAYAKAIFDLGQELSDSLGDNPRKGHARIQIGISSFIPKAIAHSVLRFLSDSHHDLYLNVVEGTSAEMAEGLKIHKLDMVLDDTPYRGDSADGIQNHLLVKTPLVLCANKSLAQKFPRIPQDLNQAPMILPTSQSQTYHNLQEYFLRHKIKPRIIAEIQDLELTRRLVLSGKGIAPINEHTVLTAPDHEKLLVLGKKSLDIYDTVYLIKKERKTPHPLVERLLKDFNLG